MRLGSLIKLKPEWEERYIILHKHTFPGVMDRIHKSNIRNYSIFLKDGMLFSFFEYIGNDSDGDMAKISKDPVTQDWWKLTEPMQEPLETFKNGQWWALMDEIFHWSEKNESHEKTRRMAFTTRILDGFESKMVEISDLIDIKSFSVYRKDGCLYSYFKFLDEDLGSDIRKLQECLKVENELDWLPMREVFHTD